MIPSTLFFLLAAGGLTSTPNAPARHSSSVAEFERLCEYLADGSGKWVAPNEEHDPSARNSPEAYGLVFACNRPKRVLTLQIESYRAGRTRAGWHSVWYWHPGRGEIVYLSYGGNGVVIEGTTEFTNDTTFVTTTEVFAADGARSRSRDDNFIVNHNEHRNTTYSFNDGEWEATGHYVWTRQSNR